MLGVALGLAAIELIPAGSVLPWLSRSPTLSRGMVPRNYQLHPVNLLQLFSPRALGGPADFDGVDNYWESVFSFGLVPLVLVGVAVRGCLAAAAGPGLGGPCPAFNLVCRGTAARALFGLVLVAPRVELVSRSGKVALPDHAGNGDSRGVRTRGAANPIGRRQSLAAVQLSPGESGPAWSRSCSC